MEGGRGQGGTRSWRFRLGRRVPPDTTARPGAHGKPSGDEGVSGEEPEAAGGGAGRGGTGAMTTDGPGGQASLDHVLRRAAAARAEPADELH